MSPARILQLALFVLTFVLFRAVGELTLVYLGHESVGLLGAMALASQHALIVGLLAVLLASKFGERTYRLAPMMLLSLTLFLGMLGFGVSRDWSQFGTFVEVSLDTAYVMALTVLAYFASMVLARSARLPDISELQTMPDAPLSPDEPD